MGKPGQLGDANASQYNKEQEILPPHEGGAMWFYSLPKHDQLCYPASKIFHDYQEAVKYGNIFSMNVGPDYQGKIRDIDVKTLQEVGKMIRESEQ